MSFLEKLFGIASIAQRGYGRWLFQRILSGIILIAGLTIVASIMISALLVVGLGTAYMALLQYGSEPQAALIVIAVAAVLIIAALITAMLICLHRMRQIPLSLIKRSPIASRAMDTLDAFTEGLMAD